MLTNENYFSLDHQQKYMGVSQFKSFEKCQASALAEVTGNFEREKTTALLVGSYVDAHFEGSLDVFKAHNPQLFKRDGSLKAEYIKAEQIINRVEEDKLFMQFMSGNKQVIMIGEIEGEMGDSHVGLQARLMSQALRKLAGTISKTNCVAIFINQLREKVGVMFGSPEVTTGGRALKFYASIRLDVRRIESIKSADAVIGNRTRVKVTKNKVAPPFKQAVFFSYFVFDF